MPTDDDPARYLHGGNVCPSCGVWLSIDSYRRETENGAVYRRFRYCPECGAKGAIDDE